MTLCFFWFYLLIMLLVARNPGLPKGETFGSGAINFEALQKQAQDRPVRTLPLPGQVPRNNYLNHPFTFSSYNSKKRKRKNKYKYKNNY